jgi:hypothetical protein
VIKNQAKKRKNKILIRADALKWNNTKKKRKKRSKTVISKLLSSTGPLYLVWTNHKWTCCHKWTSCCHNWIALYEATYPTLKIRRINTRGAYKDASCAWQETGWEGTYRWSSTFYSGSMPIRWMNERANERTNERMNDWWKDGWINLWMSFGDG